MNITKYEDCTNGAAEASHWMYIIQAIVSIFIILENFVMMATIIHNWYNLTRQHNMYRYLVSLVVADLLYGVILLIHAISTGVNFLATDRESLLRDELKDIANNLISGVLHGCCFASLASASLLNIVLRMTYTRALARAAAIDGDNPRRFSFFRLPSLRCPRTTRILIGFIWALTLTFIVTPLMMHCHQHITRCVTDDDTYKIIVQNELTEGVENLKSAMFHDDQNGKLDCSFLRAPNSRSYILVLNFCITLSWCMMVFCNMMTICIKTNVKKAVHKVSGEVILTLRHKLGVTWDSSSLLVGIITLSMTISTVPYVVFSFVTEGGYLTQRLEYARTLTPNIVMFFEMTTSLSSFLNPFIYTAMLSKLRSDISRLFEMCHKRATCVCVNCTDCCCLLCNQAKESSRKSSAVVGSETSSLDKAIVTRSKAQPEVTIQDEVKLGSKNKSVVKQMVTHKSQDEVKATTTTA